MIWNSFWKARMQLQSPYEFQFSQKAEGRWDNLDMLLVYSESIGTLRSAVLAAGLSWSSWNWWHGWRQHDCCFGDSALAFAPQLRSQDLSSSIPWVLKACNYRRRNFMLQRFCRICLAVNKPRSCSETLRLGVGMEIFHGMQKLSKNALTCLFRNPRA